jgi:putative pyruvate formate lyase activating enzyme
VIEFSYCNLRCRTCDEPEIRQRGRGREMDPEEIADGMIKLQGHGVDVLVLRRPSHVIAQTLEALEIAIERGLHLPIVYDTGGYDHPTGLALLEGVVDVYASEVKFGNSGAGRQVARVRDYASKCRKALLEMHRQVGDLEIDADGLARRGLLVRHRVLPNGLAHSGPVLRFLAEQISPHTALNLVDGFEPVYQSSDLPMLRRGLEAKEFERAQSLADRYGLHRHVH